MAYNKYRNIKTVVDGITFASKKEAQRYADLVLLARGGVIRELARQPKYALIVAGTKVGTYIADFTYFDVPTGKDVIEDAKGMKTPVYNLKKKILAANGIHITEV